MVAQNIILPWAESSLSMPAPRQFNSSGIRMAVDLKSDLPKSKCMEDPTLCTDKVHNLSHQLPVSRRYFPVIKQVRRQQ